MTESTATTGASAGPTEPARTAGAASVAGASDPAATATAGDATDPKEAQQLAPGAARARSGGSAAKSAGSAKSARSPGASKSGSGSAGSLTAPDSRPDAGPPAASLAGPPEGQSLPIPPSQRPTEPRPTSAATGGAGAGLASGSARVTSSGGSSGSGSSGSSWLASTTAGRPGERPAGAPASGSASVPASGPAGLVATGSARPTYIRPPGMPPPPDQFSGMELDGPGEQTIGVPASAALSSAAKPYVATAPVSAPPRVTGRAPAGGVTVRPIGAAGAGTAIGAAAVTDRVRPRPGATPRGPRRARLGVKRIDPWSVMKFSFAVSLVMFIVTIVAAAVLYLALDTMGVFESVNSTVSDLVDAGGSESGTGFQITAQGVIGTAAVLGGLNVLLFTSLATLGAFIYNVCADLVGGVEITLAERD